MIAELVGDAELAGAGLCGLGQLDCEQHAAAAAAATWAGSNEGIGVCSEVASDVPLVELAGQGNGGDWAGGL